MISHIWLFSMQKIVSIHLLIIMLDSVQRVCMHYFLTITTAFIDTIVISIFRR